MKTLFFSLILVFLCLFAFTNTSYSEGVKTSNESYEKRDLGDLLKNLYKSTGVYEFSNPVEGKLDANKKEAMSIFNQTWGRAIMIIIAFS